MPKYKALHTGFDGLCIREPGAEFDYEGEPAHWMELVVPSEKKSTKRAKADAEETSTEVDSTEVDSDAAPRKAKKKSDKADAEEAA